jgi:two-component system, cell cycle sensor histidine kinase and response regulator CckA
MVGPRVFRYSPCVIVNDAGPQSLVVLLVDDEAMIRSLFGAFLRSKGFVVIEAGNGLEGLGQTRGKGIRPDLVIADLLMPEMGGFALLEELRRDDTEIAALLISGFCDNSDKLSRALDERTRFLQKPFNFAMLEKEIEPLLQTPPSPAGAPRQKPAAAPR